ncbi:unnamed protein product, partial [Ectocarpus sp. 12 AP-2014]
AIGAQIVSDVRFSPEPQLLTDMGKFSYIHKIKDGKHIYYFTNSSDEMIETEVILKGQINLGNWNPHTGYSSKIDKLSHFEENGQQFTKGKLVLQPVNSTFWISP